MQEFKRTYHKQRKWICRHCDKIRFQKPSTKKTDT
jgi:hypothetical protein